jgi:O-antigen/teichoic acid export membrane protein
MLMSVAASLVLSIATVFVLPEISGDLARLRDPGYAAVFVIGTVALTIGAIFDYIFLAQRAAGNMFSRNAVMAASKVLIVVLLTVLLGKSPLDVLGAWAGAAVVAVGAAAVLLIRRVHPVRMCRPRVVARTAIDLRSRIAGHQFIGMGAALLPYLLPLMVTARLSATENAYFYTTWMMAGLFLIISPALSQALFAEGAHRPHELRSTTTSALEMIGVVLVPCIVLGIVFGGVILTVFGPGYRAHTLGLLRIALLASVPDAVTNVYVSVLRVRNRLAVAAGLNMGMGIGIVALTWWLLPALGINAVGWAFLIMQTCGCGFVLFDLRRHAMAGIERELPGPRQAVIASTPGGRSESGAAASSP